MSIQTFLIKSLIIEIDFSFAESNTLSSIIFINSFKNSNIINNNLQLSSLNTRILTNVFQSIIFRSFVFNVININNLKNQSSLNDFISQTNVFCFSSSNNSSTFFKKSNFRFFSVVDNELKNKSFIFAAITFNISTEISIDEVIFRHSMKSMLIALNSAIQIVIKISTNVIIRQIKKMFVNQKRNSQSSSFFDFLLLSLFDAIDFNQKSNRFVFKKLNFFDFIYDEKSVVNVLSLKNTNKNIIYRDVYTFIVRAQAFVTI